MKGQQVLEKRLDTIANSDVFDNNVRHVVDKYHALSDIYTVRFNVYYVPVYR